MSVCAASSTRTTNAWPGRAITANYLKTHFDMDYKEAYDDICQKLMSAYNTTSFIEVKKAIGQIHPELRESEDERIRRWIANYIHKGVYSEEEHPMALKAIEWLEKQKEPCCTEEVKKWKKELDGLCKEHYGQKSSVWDNPIMTNEMLMEKQKEPENVSASTMAPACWEVEMKKQEVGHLHPEDYPMTPEECIKPAEWSEEDEDMLNSCISSIEEAKENRYAYKETDGDTSYDHEIAWLKSLRHQPKTEWSKEDKNVIETLIRELRLNAQFEFAVRKLGLDYVQTLTVLDKCRRLCPRPSWKPSEEQMEALESAVKLYKDTHFEIHHEKIVSLYEQLKKLM